MPITRKFQEQLYQNYRQHSAKLMRELGVARQSAAQKIYPNLPTTPQAPKQFRVKSENTK